MKQLKLTPTTLFGLLVGATFIVASLLFFKTGRVIALNYALNNIILTLTILGMFTGIKHYRDELLKGVISFEKAFVVGFKILVISTFLYSVYLYILYKSQPELLESYRQTSIVLFQNAYGNSEFSQLLESYVLHELTPGAIAFIEFFQKMILGALFTLLLSSIMKRKAPPPQQPS